MTTATSSELKRRPRGRPPVGLRPLTNSEIKLRYRLRKRQFGVRQFSLMLEARHHDIIERMAASCSLSKRQLVQLLLDEAMGRLELMQLAAQAEKDRGGDFQSILAEARRVGLNPYEGIAEEGGEPPTT